MTPRARAEISVIVGLAGFFLGGLINVSREIVDIMLGAVVGGGAVFFVSFFILGLIFGSDGVLAEKDEFVPAEFKKDSDSKKGKKIDIVIKDDM